MLLVVRGRPRGHVMSTLAPGLWVATVRGVPGESIVMVGDDGNSTFSLDGEGNVRRCYVFTDARPLITLDTNYVTATRVADILRDAGYAGIADQITEQIKPARIPEPGLWGVVEASYSESQRCHYALGTDGLWHSLRPPFTGIVVVPWDLLIDPVLVRSGVQS